MNATRARLILCFMIGNVIYSAIDAGNTARNYVSLHLDKPGHIISTGYAMSVEMSIKIPF